MKTFIFLSWLIFAAAGYGGYLFYQDAIKEREQARVASATQREQIKLLAGQVETLRAALEQKSQPSPSAAPGPELATSNLPPSATNFPAIITTTTGKTYQGCRLERAYPDGISVIHATGVAKIAYSDLEASFAASFGYDPEKARQFAQEEAIKSVSSDQARSDHIAAQRAQMATAAPSPSAVSTLAPTSTPAHSTISPEQTTSIQIQIKALTEHIAFMQAQEAKMYEHRILKSNGAKMTHGAYDDKIVEETAQISALQAQLR